MFALHGLRGLLIGVMALTLSLTASAQQDNKAAAEKAWNEAKAAAQNGPQDIPLAGLAVLHLPEGKTFIPRAQSVPLMHAMGNPGEYKDLQGLIFPTGEANWFTVVRYEASGHIKDDEAKDWNADDMLKSFREGTEASNEERQKMGAAPMEIVGWAEKPAYDATTHRLVWAMSTRDKGAPADAPRGVNYNTYALGREGYLSFNLITSMADLPKDKPEAHALLAATSFDEGKRYADFNSSTDHVAEYGLAALVLGVGAKKLGLLAVAFAFLAKFAKVLVLGVAGVGAALAKWRGSRKAKAEAQAAAKGPGAV